MINGAITLGFPVVHGMLLLCLSLSLLFSISRSVQAARYAFLAGLLCLSLNLALLLLSAQRLPLYGMFESMTTILWVAGICLYLETKARPWAGAIPGIGTMAALGAFMCFFPLQANHDFFMYANPWVQSFFFFRLLSAGIILYAGIRSAAAWAGVREKPNPVHEIRRRHMLFLLGTILFLSSELSGSIWCLKGWGDSWHWSENFLQSAAIFFLIMLNLHIPSHLLKSAGTRERLGTLSALAMVILFVW